MPRGPIQCLKDLPAQTTRECTSPARADASAHFEENHG
jgi:hypothetical protein